ncbi:transcription initiation factor TFIID subunit 4B-like [Microplitis mediator]|uniref:transcription initiation factor TFIID subunit 4B-like n=1 Tax=Microplitis mediator TaxID=375433 RepID=UPI002555C112|nr:transcription initiation factor TFIID subunit 4B-like [Microplitis mediator]
MASANSVEHALSTMSINVDESVVNTIKEAGEQVAVPRVVSTRRTVKTRLSRRRYTFQTHRVRRFGTPEYLGIRDDNGQVQYIRMPGRGLRALTRLAKKTAVEPPVPAAPTPQQPEEEDNCAAEECRKFFALLLRTASSREPSVEDDVRTLIEELIDTKVEPQEFCDGLRELLHIYPQPSMVDWLKKTVPFLRQSNQVMPPPKAHL